LALWLRINMAAIVPERNGSLWTGNMLQKYRLESAVMTSGQLHPAGHST
jgi:hypothetical protein